jgi:hypothetical protein
LAFHAAALIPLTALVLATGALADVTSGETRVYALLGATGGYRIPPSTIVDVVALRGR